MMIVRARRPDRGLHRRDDHKEGKDDDGGEGMLLCGALAYDTGLE